MSRRDLFYRIIGKDSSSGGASDKRNIDTESYEAEEKFFSIGRVGEFPVDEKGEKKFLSKYSVYVESLPEGIRVQSSSNENKYFAVKVNQFGELIVNCSESWPAEALLSVMTNEPIYLDKSQEESLYE